MGTVEGAADIAQQVFLAIAVLAVGEFTIGARRRIGPVFPQAGHAEIGLDVLILVLAHGALFAGHGVEEMDPRR